MTPEILEIVSATVEKTNFKYYHTTRWNKEKCYAAYHILDFTNSKSISVGAKDFLKTNKELMNLHKAVIGDKFYNSEENVQFNLYFIIVVADTYQIDCNIIHNFQNEYSSSRKLFFTETQAKNYFSMREILWYKDKSNKYSDLVEKINKLKSIDTQIESFGVSSDEEPKCNFNDAGSKIKSIDEIIFKNYKHFEDDKRLGFKQVNLIVSVNGGGKSSIFKAIKESITDSALKNEVKVRCTIEENGSTISVETPLTSPIESMVANYFNPEYTSKFDNSSDQPQTYIMNFLFPKWQLKTKNHLDNLGKLGSKRVLPNTNFSSQTIKFVEEHIHLLEDEQNKIKNQLNTMPHYEDKIPLNNEKEKINAAKNKTELILEYIKQLNEIIISDLPSKVSEMYSLFTNKRDYSEFTIPTSDFNSSENILKAKRNWTERGNVEIPISEMSTGQRSCMSLAIMLSMFCSEYRISDFIILDEPTIHLDMQHTLNIFDIIRELAIKGVQIFFASNNNQLEHLFRQKFKFLGNRFQEIHITEGKSTISNKSSIANY